MAARSEKQSVIRQNVSVASLSDLRAQGRQVGLRGCVRETWPEHLVLI
jgi:hypothetical protein